MKSGRAEIRLADTEIDDVAALRDQSVGAGEHRKGVFLADAVEGRYRFQHGIGSRGEFAGSSPDRERKIKLDGLWSGLAAIMGADIALQLQPDERIGIIAQIIVGVMDRPSREQVRAAVARICGHRRGMRRHMFLVLAALAASAGKAAAKTTTRTPIDPVSLSGSDAMDASFHRVVDDCIVPPARRNKDAHNRFRSQLGVGIFAGCRGLNATPTARPRH